MMKRLLGLAALLVLAVPAAAKEDGASIAKQMKAALEPARASTRKLTLMLSGSPGEPERKLVAGQAMKKFPEGQRLLHVMLFPDDAKGMASIIQEQGKSEDVLYLYLPMTRRVRKIVPLGAYQTFLNTDLFYGDMGFVSLQPTYKLLAKEIHNGVLTYKLEAVPKSHWYYSRVVTWIAADTFLPIERNFYDGANQLWKVERFELGRVQDVPTVVQLTMEDIREKTRTQIDFSDVHYDADLPDGLFDPDKLSEAPSSPVWGFVKP